MLPQMTKTMFQQHLKTRKQIKNLLLFKSSKFFHILTSLYLYVFRGKKESDNEQEPEEELPDEMFSFLNEGGEENEATSE